ncbi:helix-turn-helix domain-containing protein [Agathobacter sp.]
MAKRKKDTMEFRFYELPQGESALVLCGESWKRVYGHEELHLHFHNLMEIGICRQGNGDLYLDEDIYQYHDGDISFIPENFPHVTVSYGDVVNFWEYIFIDLRSIIEEMFPNNAAFQNEAVSTLSKRAVLTNIHQSSVAADYINGIIRETQEGKAYAQRTITLLVQGLVIELLRREDELPEENGDLVKGTNMSQIASALDYMNKHYSEQIKAGELSSLCNMSETHFRRLFESYINMPPMEYLNLIRVQKACELMKKTNEPMELIAQKCGFTTPSTFNRNFRKFLNTSPYQWKINPENYEHKLLNFRISALKGW